MPPRFVYWTILAGGLPTAFRSNDREELLATFNRIKEKHPDAEMKFFARGKLWRETPHPGVRRCFPRPAVNARLPRKAGRLPRNGPSRLTSQPSSLTRQSLRSE